MLFVAIGLVIGLVVAPIAFNVATETGGTVAVVPLQGGIDGGSAAAVSAMLTQAREDPSIDAVVLVVNSGGGGAAASEELYFQTKRTAAAKPLVTSIDGAAASGAYYASAPSDYIYTKPASIVGSVGVLAPLPTELEPNDIVGTTGPNKLTGGDKREFLYTIESLQRAFVGAVQQQRGENLTLSRSELEQARIYSGAQAVQNGLADEIGDRGAAVRKAAEIAGLDNYDVRVLTPGGEAGEGSTKYISQAAYLASDLPDKQKVSIEHYAGNGSEPVFLMIAPVFIDTEEYVTVQATRADPEEVRNASVAA